jgi:hypothetical protein
MGIFPLLTGNFPEGSFVRFTFCHSVLCATYHLSLHTPLLLYPSSHPSLLYQLLKLLYDTILLIKLYYILPFHNNLPILLTTLYYIIPLHILLSFNPNLPVLTSHPFIIFSLFINIHILLSSHNALFHHHPYSHPSIIPP